METNSSNIAASSAKSHQTLLILKSSSFGFNSSCTMRLQPVLVPACFLAAFCYFFFYFIIFFSGACELQGQAKVKLYHFGDEMQADVAVSCDTVPAPLRWGLGVVPGTPDHVPSLAARRCPFPDLVFKEGARPGHGSSMEGDQGNCSKFQYQSTVPTAALCLALGRSAGR